MHAVKETLLAAVYAAPDDDAPRLVYADWLQEQGDPRGELIALQIARTHQEPTHDALDRERYLIENHCGAWLAPIWNVLYHMPYFAGGQEHQLAFRRGFVDEVVMNFRSPWNASVVGNPLWSTVRTLIVRREPPLLVGGALPREARAVYLHDVLRQLVTFVNAHREVAVELLQDARPRRLEALGVAVDPTSVWGQAFKEALIHGTGLPELRELAFSHLGVAPGPSAYDWLWASALGKRLDTFTLVARDVDAEPWRAWGELPPNLRTVRFCWGKSTVRTQR